MLDTFESLTPKNIGTDLGYVMSKLSNWIIKKPFSIRSINISYEKHLTQYLLETYSVAGRGGRPVINMNEVTEVRFGLGLIQMNLDEKEKVLETSVWTQMVITLSSLWCKLKPIAK